MGADRPRTAGARPVSRWGFTGVAVTSFGGPLALAALGGVTLTHLSTPVATFGSGAPAGATATATAQTALLYICGSLPLFLGGELARPARTIPRGMVAAFLATGAVMIAAVAPLAAAPSIAQADIPGMVVARAFAGQGFAVAAAWGWRSASPGSCSSSTCRSAGWSPR